MKAGLPAAFANSAPRRDPTTGEISGGFPCGPADIELFDELFYRSTQGGIEIANVIVAAGLTPSEGDLAQLLKAILVLSGSNIVVYGTPGSYSWTVPDGVYRIYAEVWAGGGGGGGASSGNQASGANGGGYSAGWRTVSPGDVIPIVVGVGGTGGTTGNNGTSGGSSSVGTASPISATGGGGGQANGVASATTGAGSGGLLNVAGMKAANGYLVGSVPIGSAGAGAFGTSANAISVSGGFPGGVPGGGGGGAANGNGGGDGGRGLVVIQY